MPTPPFYCSIQILLEKGTKNMRIGLFTDTHYCTQERLGNSDRYPRRSLDKLNYIAEMAKKENVDLLVCLGDFINMEGSEAQDHENLQTASAVLRSSGIPCVCCLGNHDGEITDKDTFAALTGFITAPYAVEYEPGKQLVFLDANYSSDNKPYVRHKVDWTDANVPPEEIIWMKETLRDKENIVFIHQNVDKTLEPHHIVKNCDELLSIFLENNVKAVYQGHYHYGGETNYQGIHLVTLKASCVFHEDYFQIIQV